MYSSNSNQIVTNKSNFLKQIYNTKVQMRKIKKECSVVQSQLMQVEILYN